MPRKKSVSDTEQTQKANIAKLTDVLIYLKPYKKYVFCAILALLVTSTSVLAIGRGVGFLVDNGLAKSDSDMLDSSLQILLVIIFCLAFGTFARFYFITLVGEKVVADIRRSIYKHVVHLSPQFFETNKSGDVISRIISDTNLIQIVVSSSLSIALRNSLLLIGGFILLLFTSVKLTAIVFIVVPVVVFPIVFLGKKLRVLSKKYQEKISDISSHSEESINAIKTIQSLTRESLEINSFDRLIDNSVDVAKQRIFLRSSITALVILFIFSAIACVIRVGGYDVFAGKMSAGDLSSFIFYSVVVAGATGAISEVIGDLQRAAGATERIMELLSEKSAIKDDGRHDININDIKGDVKFDNVIFNYPTKPKILALDKFTYNVSQGQNIAIVGESGAGKSTIFELLMRFYDLKSGFITIDGIDIKNFRLKDLRSIFAIIPQEPVIFSDTAYNNILVARPNATKQEVVEAANLALVTEFIDKLPNKWDSFLGEKGVLLSGGQKQRIAIARAFLQNPKILLLDEATSALDAKNEKLLQKSFENLMKNRTSFVISHRFLTVKNADEIIVIDDGKIIEKGDHKSLVNINGTYAKLANYQFER